MLISVYMSDVMGEEWEEAGQGEVSKVCAYNGPLEPPSPLPPLSTTEPLRDIMCLLLILPLHKTRVRQRSVWNRNSPEQVYPDVVRSWEGGGGNREEGREDTERPCVRPRSISVTFRASQQRVTDEVCLFLWIFATAGQHLNLALNINIYFLDVALKTAAVLHHPAALYFFWWLYNELKEQIKYCKSILKHNLSVKKVSFHSSFILEG